MELLLFCIVTLLVNCQLHKTFSVSEIDVFYNYTKEENIIIKQYFPENLIPSDNGLHYFEFSVSSFSSKIFMEFNCSNCLWQSLVVDNNTFNLESSQSFNKELEFKTDGINYNLLISWKVFNKTNQFINFSLLFMNKTEIFYKKSFKKVKDF